MALEFSSAPVRDEIAVPDPTDKKLYMPRVWIDWVTALTVRLESSAERVNTVELIGQSASLLTTAMPTGILTDGLYRVSYYVRVTTPAGVSSSLTLSLGWTDGGVPIVYTTSPMTTNTDATVTGAVILIRLDQASPLTFSTVYASDPAGVMRYSLDIVLERVAA